MRVCVFAYGNIMNEYMQGLTALDPYDQYEDPNPWAQMLMSLASTNNSWSAEQAQKQMDFQERMSNTAHQREVADLKAAGLNPILSAKLGGASTPSGASATADTSIVGSIVQLMDKMLDVQGTSAAAAYNASGGYNETYGYDTGSSGYQELTSKDQADLFKLVKGNPNENSIDAVKKVLNNVGVTAKKGIYYVGTKISNTTENAGKFYENVGNKISNSKVGETAKKVVSAVKDFGKWLVTGKK